jgi:hypothetical protein
VVKQHLGIPGVFTLTKDMHIIFDLLAVPAFEEDRYLIKPTVESERTGEYCVSYTHVAPTQVIGDRDRLGTPGIRLCNPCETDYLDIGVKTLAG